MNKAFSIILSIFTAVAAAGLSGCGGDRAQATSEASAVCTPSPAEIGQTIECSLEGLSAADLQDCTFFVEKTGARIPVSADVSETGKNGASVSFRMPVLLDRKVNLLVGCADEFQTLASLTIGEDASSGGNGDTILPVHEANPAPSTAPSEETQVSGGSPTDEIVPIVPATPRAVEPSEPSSAVASSPVPAPFTVSLEGSLVANPVRLGAVHLNGSVLGGGTLREAYLYGPFAPDGNCERLLAIDPSGGPLNPGSPNDEIYRGFTGVRCDAAAGNCEGFTATSADGTSAPVNCRVDLNRDRTSFDFYFRLSQPSSQAVLVAEAEDGTVRTSRTTVAASSLAANLSGSQIVISDSAPEFSVSFLFNHASGNPSVEGCSSQSPAPSVSGASGNYKREHCALPESGDAVVTLSVPGVTGDAASETYRIACGEPQSVLKKMGFVGAAGETCTVSEDGWGKSCDAAGELELQGEAWKTCEIQKGRPDGGFDTVASYTVPWVTMKLTEVSAPGGSCATANAVWTAADPAAVRNGRAILNRRLKRTHDCYNYTFSVKGSDGQETTLTQSAPFEASFELMAGTAYQYCVGQDIPQGGFFVSKPGTVDQYYKSGYNKCPANTGDHIASSWFGAHMYTDANATDPFKVSWQGRHLKRIGYRCSVSGPGVDPVAISRFQRYDRNWQPVPMPKSVENVNAIQPDPSSYVLQTAPEGLRIKDAIMWATVSCTVTATTYDDQVITRTHSWDACTAQFPQCLAQ